MSINRSTLSFYNPPDEAVLMESRCVTFFQQYGIAVRDILLFQQYMCNPGVEYSKYIVLHICLLLDLSFL